MARPHVDKVIHKLWAAREGAHVFAILDAARDKRIYSLLLGLKSGFCCLYRGEMAQRLAHVAPYLVELDQGSAFTREIIGSGWGDSWGIYLNAPASLRELRKHFRQFLTVYDESANSLYFRYYDPRVLRAFLPTCDVNQLTALFGPVTSYFVEADEGVFLIQYSMANRRLMQEKVHLIQR
jgi:hypothetical protein